MTSLTMDSAMTMPFSDALEITRRHSHGIGRKHAELKAQLLKFASMTPKNRADLPVPALLRRIADEMRCTVTMAARVVQANEDEKLRNILKFQDNPATLGDLVLWDVVNDFFQEKCRGKSEKSAWTKALSGYKDKNGEFVSGLKDDIGTIPALAAFYMLFGGAKAFNRVMNISGWSWEYVKNILSVATLRIHNFLKYFGKKTLSVMETLHTGMSFTLTLMGIVRKGLAADEAKKAAQKKDAKRAKIQKVIDNAVDDESDDFDESEDDGNIDLSAPDDLADLGHDAQDEITEPTDGFDNPEAPPPDDQDDENADDDQDEPPKTPRAVAFHLLESTRMRLERIQERSEGDQRLLDLLRLVDPPGKLVGALQKDLSGPMDARLSQRMTDLLNLAWQWANRIGVFAEIPKHKKYLGMTPEQFLPALITAVRGGYLSPDEVPKPPKPKPQKGEKVEPDTDDPGRQWLQVMDWETGRVARVVQKAPPGAVGGTVSKITVADEEIIGLFMRHVKMNKKPSDRKKFNPDRIMLRFWATVSLDGMTQVITCEKQTHLPKKSIEQAVEDIESVVPMDDPDNAGSLENASLDDVHVREDMLQFREYRALSEILKIPAGRLQEGLTGDKDMMEAVYKAIQALSNSDRRAAQDMVLHMLQLDRDDLDLDDDIHDGDQWMTG